MTFSVVSSRLASTEPWLFNLFGLDMIHGSDATSQPRGCPNLQMDLRRGSPIDACTFIPQELGTALLMSVTWRAEPLSLLNRQT